MCEIRPLIAGRLDLHCHGDLKVGELIGFGLTPNAFNNATDTCLAP